MASLSTGAEVRLSSPTAGKAVWAGRILSGIVTALLLMDGVMKLAKPAPVVEAVAKLGYPDSTTTGIGVLLLVCTVLYALPRTAVLGAVLLTGYLGGATATNLRVEAGAFNVLFPSIIGALVWGGLMLRDRRLTAVFPLRN